jgi:glycosyltransferase involved in cell wall biosynthesis
VLYVWRPKYANALELVPHDASVYHIVDEYSFSQEDPPTSEEELGLIQSADELIVHSPALMDKKGRGGSTSYIPNGVDYDAFSAACAEPADLAGIPNPRIGYCGYLKHQLDWDLLTRLIERHPQYSWVFVGALAHKELAGLIEDLDRRPNVHFLGGKTSEELARYPQHFDVCIMPYTQDAYTRYIFPLKLHEYLASGRPTVGTPIRSLLEYEEIIELADGIDEWTRALETSLAPAASAPERAEERRQVARAFDWDALADQVDELLGNAVA